MPNPIVHFEIMGKNGKKLQEFYSNLFGWKIDANNPMNYGLAFTKDGQTGIDGGIGQTDERRPPYVTCYAAVEGIQSYLDKAVKLGASIVVPVTVVPNTVTFCLFKDPDGNTFGIIEGRAPSA